MGGIQRAGTGKNKKVTEISSLLAFWPVGLGIKNFKNRRSNLGF